MSRGLASLGELLAELGIEVQRLPREHVARDRLMRDERERRLAAERMGLRAIQGCVPRPVLDELDRAGISGTPAVQVARQWSRSDRRGLVMRGSTGVGKTCAAAVAVVELVKSGRVDPEAVSWHRPDDFISGMLHAYDSSAPRIGRELVVIDDVGTESKGDLSEALCRFLDLHYARFIATTMLDRKRFWERYAEPGQSRGGRLMERLNHDAKAFTLKGESLRRQDGGV